MTQPTDRIKEGNLLIDVFMKVFPIHGRWAASHYDKDWNQLMPAIVKCKETLVKSEDATWYASLAILYSHINTALLNLDIQLTHASVLDFITVFNQQNKEV